MQQPDLEKNVFRVLNSGRATVGAGFMLAPRLAVTCAHVVSNANSRPGDSLLLGYEG